LRKEKSGRRFTEEEDNDETGGRSGRVEEQRAFGKPQFLLVVFKASREERLLCFTQWKNALFTGSG
jgi:hypothetical protein